MTGRGLAWHLPGEKEGGVGDEGQHVKGEEREGGMMPALPWYCYLGRYQGKGGWGWQPALGNGVEGVVAIGAGPRTRGNHCALHIHCIFFGKLPKEAFIEAAADTPLNPGLGPVNVNQG